MHTALILAQAQPPQGGQAPAAGAVTWLTFVLLLRQSASSASSVTRSSRIVSIAMTMGAVGIFFTLVKIGFVDDFATWVSGWLNVNDASFTPILMIAISIGVGSAQVFQESNDTVQKVLDKIPDPIEYGVVILCALIGGLAMAATPAWATWFTDIANLMVQIWHSLVSTFNLFGGFIDAGSVAPAALA